MQMQQQNQVNDPYARLEAMRQQHRPLHKSTESKLSSALRINEAEEIGHRVVKVATTPQLSVELEQYPTEGDFAAFFVLALDQLDHLENKHVVDLGAGNGTWVLAVNLGSNKVTMIEV